MQKIEQLNINTEGLSENQITRLVGKSTSDQLQSYIDKINEISNIDLSGYTEQEKIDFGVLQAQDYANALKDVSASQAALLLSTQGVTKAQIAETLVVKEGSTAEAYKAMVEAGLLKSKQSLTNAELQNTIATALGNEEDAKAVMSHMGLAVAIEGEEVQTVQLTAKKLQQAIATGLVTEAQAQEIAMITGVTIAQNKQVAITMPKWIANMKAMALATWEQVKATAAWLVTNPAGWATLAIGGIVGVTAAIKRHNKEAEEAKQKIRDLGETARSEIDSINSEFESTKSTVDNVAEKYATLAQGIQNLGAASQSQGTLSNDEYSEFLDISNQLADLFPRLTTGYDDNGNAILNLSGDVDTITSSLYKYVDAEKAAASVDMQEKMGDIWGEHSQNVNDYSSKYNSLAAERTGLSNFYSSMLNGEIDYLYTYYKDFEDLFLQAGIDESVFNEVSVWSDFTEEQQNNIKDAYADLIKEYETDINNYANQIESANKDFSNYLITSLQGTDYYEKLGDNKSIVNSLLTNYGYDTELNDFRGSDNWDEALKYIKEQIIDPFNKLSDEDKEVFQNYYNDLLSIDTEAALANNIPKIEEYISKLADLLGMDAKKLQIGLGYDLESDKDTLNKAYSRLGYNNNISSASDAKRNKEIQDFVNGLNEEEIEILMSIPSKDITDDWEKLRDKIKNEAIEVNVSIEPIDPTTSLNSIKDAFSDLESIYDDIHNGTSVAADSIEALNEAFGELDNGTALQEFKDVLTTMPDDIDAQQEALNKLATTYIDNSGLLDNLTEGNAEYVKSELEKIGVTNAEEVVQSRLVAQSAEYRKAVKGETNAIDEKTFASYKAQLANVGYSDSVINEIDALYRESISAGKTQDEIYELITAKLRANQTTLRTDGDIKNLSDLIDGIGKGISALNTLATAKMPVGIARYAAPKLAQVNFGGTNSNSSSGSGSGGSSSAKDTKDSYEELFDFFERRIDVLNNALELLNSNLENVISSVGKNQLIDAQISINKESINNYTDALEMYQQKANEALAKIPADLQSKIVDGAVSLVDFIGSGNEDLVDAINDYQDWADKVADCKQELAELKETLHQLELDKFNNIIEDFTNQFDISTNAQDLLNKQIDLFEEAGQLIGDGLYNGLIKESESQLSILEQEKQALMNELTSGLDSGLIEKGTDEWLEMIDALNEVDGSIIDCKKDIEEFNNAIQDLHWDIIDRIQGNFDDLSSEISNLIGLIDDVDVSDTEGVWSNEGLIQLGLYAQEYEKSIYAVKMYEEEIAKLNAAYARGEYSATEYADKLSELKDAEWDEINASEDAKDAIMELNKARIDIMVTAIEEEIDAMKELIDSKKEALDAEKDLYEYRTSLTEKNKSVTDLERQIAAMQNDNTAATIAKRKQLEEQLAEAKQDLADYEYEHSIDVQKDALDQQYEDFETEKNAEIDALNATLNDMEAVITASFQTVKNNANNIGAEIALIAQQHGAIISESLITSWASGENAIASYGMTLDAGASNFLLNMGNMVQGVYGLQEQANATSISLANMYNTSSANLQNELTTSYYSVANLNAITQSLNNSLINTLNRGYDTSSLVNSINSVGSAAASAAGQIANMMNALNGGTSSNGGYTYSYAGGSYGNNVVRVSDSNGNLVAITSLENARERFPGITQHISAYAKGGIVTKDDNNPLNNIAKAVGEDTIIAARDGEGILTPIQTTGFMKLVSNMDAFNNSIPNILPDIANNNIPIINKQQPNVQIHYDNLVQVQGDVNNSNIKQMEQIVDSAITKQFNQFNSNLRKAGVR